MKSINLAVLTAATALLVSPAAMARHHVENHVNERGGYVTAGAQGGFTGPSAVAATTVKQALELKDDTYVTLRGNITEHLGGDKYMFSDGTGSIKVEIDDKDWHGLTVGPKDTVEIYGEVDKGWTKTEIDVDAIKLVK